jgi:hypothetical protein
MSFTDKHQKHEEEMGCQFFDSMRGHSIQAIKKVGKHIEKNIFLIFFKAFLDFSRFFIKIFDRFLKGSRVFEGFFVLMIVIVAYYFIFKWHKMESRNHFSESNSHLAEFNSLSVECSSYLMKSSSHLAEI